MLRFEEVSFRYKEEDMLMMKDLSFQVKKGEFAAIIGASGCGKSTIFRLINGLEKPDSGRVFVNQSPIAALKNYCAFMPQRDMLFPWRSVAENVALPLEMAKVSAKEKQERTAQALAEVGLSEYGEKFPRDLSGGMRQRASFARTLLSGAELLLLDEPFSALDYLTRVDLQEWLLARWQGSGKTVLFITHDVEEAIFLAETVYIIKERPFTQMERVEIPLPYPRNREDFKRGDMIELKEDLISKLRRGEVL